VFNYVGNDEENFEGEEEDKYELHSYKEEYDQEEEGKEYGGEEEEEESQHQSTEGKDQNPNMSVGQ